MINLNLNHLTRADAMLIEEMAPLALAELRRKAEVAEADVRVFTNPRMRAHAQALADALITRRAAIEAYWAAARNRRAATLTAPERTMLAQARALNPQLSARDVDDLIFGRLTIADVAARADQGA